MLDKDLMTWPQAKVTCTALEAELLSIHSAEEQNFITSLVANKPSPFIGLTKNVTLYRLFICNLFCDIIFFFN